MNGEKSCRQLFKTSSKSELDNSIIGVRYDGCWENEKEGRPINYKIHQVCFGWNCNRERQNMITLKDSIEVNATPEKVFEWLIARFKDKESYQAWHPDHVDIRWVKGESFKEGSIIYAEEYLHGVLHKLKFRITKIVPNRVIEYRSLFPLSIVAPENTFLIVPKGKNSCMFTAMSSLRLPRWLFEKLTKKHNNKIEAAQQHIKEEGENLKRAVEK